MKKLLVKAFMGLALLAPFAGNAEAVVFQTSDLDGSWTAYSVEVGKGVNDLNNFNIFATDAVYSDGKYTLTDIDILESGMGSTGASETGGQLQLILMVL